MTAHGYLSRALQLARRGLYSTDPNPRVGCVLVRDGEVVGEGWHARAGEAHAEIYALRAAGDRARDATAYVSLEPCSHHGRTPPCADALIEAGVARVVVAMPDPNPQVAGQGLERLRAAGIEVDSGILQAQAEDLNPGYLSRMRRGRPWVRCKLAMSLDGRTAMASGESRWITGEAARRDVQRLRARSSAVMTGIGTVLADNPSLNVRLEAAELYGVEPVRQPLRVVIDRRLQLPVDARILAVAGETLVLTSAQADDRCAALRKAGAEVVVVDERDGHLDLHAILRLLAEREVNEVLLESGARLAGAMLSAGLIDELVVYMAPHLMGDGAKGLMHLPGVEHMRDRVGLTLTDLRILGSDVRMTLRPEV